MANARQQTTSANYVFKMHYDGGGAAPMNRRYGYQGELALPQVYEGLIDRSSQAFGIQRGDVVIYVRDNLGNLTKTLDSYQTFLRHVFLPIQQRPSEVKIDEKQRIVLAFAVFNKKDLDKRAERKRKEKEAQVARQAVEAAALKKRLIVEKQAALAKAQAEVRAKHASARDPPKKTPRSTPPASDSGKKATKESPKASLPQPTKPSPVVVSAEKVDATAVKPTRTATPVTSEPRAMCSKPAQPQAVDKADAWKGVQNFLETFVQNLNVHLADTFGDAAVPLDFKKLSEPSSSARSPHDVTKEEQAKPAEPAQPAALRSVVHPGVFCDGCGADMSGPRYKCKDCSNYDLCGPCIDERDKHHPSSHKFVSIARPGAPPHASERGTKLQLPVISPPVAPVVAAPIAAPVRHAATCDLCDKGIVGVRYKCLECPDFDVDAECFSNSVDQLHPHPFVRIHAREDYVRATKVDLPGRHERITCDGCQRSPIVGTRYKCMHSACPDFDLCATCEALPIPVHPRDHPLLKIRWPLERSGLNCTWAVRERVQAVIGSASSSSKPTQTPAQSSSPLTDVLEAFGIPRTMSSNSAVSNVQILEGPGDDKTIMADVDLHKISSAPALASQELEPDARMGDDEAVASTTPDETVEQAPVAAGEEDQTKAFEAQEADAMDIQIEHVTAELSEELAGANESVAAPDATQALTPAEEATPMQPEEQNTSEPMVLPRAAFVSDITLLDGIAVPAGAEFQKVWAVRAGPTGWPAGCRLVHVGGFSSRHFSNNGDRPSSFDVAAAEPNEIVSISCEAKAPEDSGRFMDFWRLSLPDGTLFGERLWIDLTISTEDMAASSAHLSGSSLATSFMAPSLDAHGKASSGPASAAHTARSSPSAPSSTVFSVPSTRDGDMSDFESVGAMTRSNTGTSVHRGVDSSAANSTTHANDSMDEDTPEADGFVYLSGQEDDF